MKQTGELGLKSVKQIAAEIGRSRTYVHGAKRAMEENGIPWPGNMMLTEVVIRFITENRYRCTKYALKCRIAQG